MREPVTRFARVGGSYVAYQHLGAGESLIYLPQWFTNVEALWDVLPLRHFVESLALFSDVVLIDKRGTGLSDPAPSDAGAFLEHFADDVLAVLDELGTDRASLVAGDSAGLLALWFAASFPERTQSLVLMNAFARLLPSGADTRDPPESFLERSVANARRMWVDGDLSEMAPSIADDPEAAAPFVRFLRLSASPGVAQATRQLLVRLDLRHLLPAIQAPTLVLHRMQDTFADIEHAEYLATHIPDAKLVALPGSDHFFYLGDHQHALAEIEVFLTGASHASADSRVLATIMFTDIVSSTEHLSAVGDDHWRLLLGEVNELIQRTLPRYGGRYHAGTGDGAIALFDGPGRAVHCASALQRQARELGLSLRTGIHTGEVEMRSDEVVGLSVHLAHRIQSVAAPGETMVSRTVVDLVAGSGLQFVDRGIHELRGITGTWQLFSPVSPT